jgi:hypothetical protein
MGSKVLRALIIGIVLFGFPVIASSVSKIIGITSYGPIPAAFPTSFSLICDGTGAAGNNCPQYFSPDFTDDTFTKLYGYTNQTTPGRCLKSVDGGVTWSFCAADPFTTSFGGTTPSAFAMGSDGSLLAAVNVNNTTQSCVIKRSTDGGVSWTTVYTESDGINACSAWNITAMPSPMKCSPIPGVGNCILIGYDTTTLSKATAWYSTDFGASWNPLAAGISYSLSSGSPPISGAALSDDGQIGISGVTVAASTRSFIYARDGATFLQSAVWGTAIGASKCEPFIYNGDPAVFCGSNNSTQTQQVMRISGTVPTTVASFSLGNGVPTSSQSPDQIAIEWDATAGIYYLISRVAVTNAVIAFVTADNFGSFHVLGTITPTITFAGAVRGDIYKWNNAVYFTSGMYTPNGHLYKIAVP